MQENRIFERRMKDILCRSMSLPDIDRQLYRKYNLTDEEISYIESTIKPME